MSPAEEAYKLWCQLNPRLSQNPQLRAAFQAGWAARYMGWSAGLLDSDGEPLMAKDYERLPLVETRHPEGHRLILPPDRENLMFICRTRWVDVGGVGCFAGSVLMYRDMRWRENPYTVERGNFITVNWKDGIAMRMNPL